MAYVEETTNHLFSTADSVHLTCTHLDISKSYLFALLVSVSVKVVLPVLVGLPGTRFQNDDHALQFAADVILPFESTVMFADV